MARSNDTNWVCIPCGYSLGTVIGGEFNPSVDGKFIRTSGANLSVVCPNCGATKIFYTSDPIVRAIYQLVNALSAVAAKSMVEDIGSFLHTNKK